MDIYIIKSVIQFKNPVTGQATKAIESHYNGRRITAVVNGEEMLFRFTKDEMPFNVTEDEMAEAIEVRIA